MWRLRKKQRKPLMPTTRIGKNETAIDSTPRPAPPSGATTANCSASEMPTKTTVRQEDRKTLRNRLRIQVPRSTNAFDAVCTVLQASDLLSQIADMRVDAAVVG